MGVGQDRGVLAAAQELLPEGRRQAHSILPIDRVHVAASKHCWRCLTSRFASGSAGCEVEVFTTVYH
jgi:hypothetical protein